MNRCPPNKSSRSPNSQNLREIRLVECYLNGEIFAWGGKNSDNHILPLKVGLMKDTLITFEGKNVLGDNLTIKCF